VSSIEDKSGFLSILNRYLVIVVLVWTVIVATLMAWDIYRVKKSTEERALSEAFANFKKDMAFRYWTASHGGVYVPVDERTPPNPYLAHVPERDITTPAGVRLTLMNPAYVMRQVNEYFLGVYGVSGHLTSLNLLNPNNKPDEWERAALESFEKGVEEVFSVAEINGEKHLRFMRPNIVEKACLKCHGHQGYEVGDVRGGVSVSIPLEQYENYKQKEYYDHFAANGILWLFGLLGVALGSRWLKSQFRATIQAQDELRVSEETRRLLLDNMAEAVFGADLEGICTFVNPACLELLGYGSVDELVGKNIHSVIHHTHEDGTPFPESECPLYNVTRQNKPAHMEREVLWRKDGSSFVTEIWFHPLAKDGKVIGAVVNFIDITERIRDEKERARLFTAMEQSREVVVITDPSGAIQYVNRAFEISTGYSRGEAIGANPRVLKSGKHDREHYKNLWDTITSGATWKGHLINKRKDGALYEEEATISPVSGDKGEITGYVAVKRDITRESRLQQARDYFTSVTSHELRTPLTKLSLARLVLEKMGRSDKLDLESVSASITALDSSINDFSRIITAGEMFTDLALYRKTMSFRDAPLSPILSYCVELSKKNLTEEKRNIEMSMSIELEKGEDQVPCDPAMIQYAIGEVISNSAKYTPDGKRIKVRMRRENENIVIYIMDEGIGISKAEKDSVFEPFYSLESTNTHSTGQYAFKSGGIGMGLTLARLIFQSHGGDLELETEGEDVGVMVVMTLPVQKATVLKDIRVGFMEKT